MRNYRELLLLLAAGTILLFLAGAGNGKAARHALRCQQSLKEIHRFANCYSADNNGYIVRSQVSAPKTRAVFWPDQLKAYAKDFRDFSCPANAKRGARAFVEDDLLPPRFVLTFVSYGINGHISGSDRRNAPIEKVVNLKDPAYTIYFGDANSLRLLATGKFWQPAWAPLHENAMQSVMADGHIEKFTQETLGTFGKVPGWKRDAARWKNWKQGR